MAAESSNPNDIADLQRQIAELQARLAARREADGDQLRTMIDTQGGAAVEGSVAAGGHFIGRDFVQIVGQLVQRGEDPGEFQAVIAHYLAALAAHLARRRRQRQEHFRRQRAADAGAGLAGPPRSACSPRRAVDARRPAANPRRPAPLRRTAARRQWDGTRRRPLGLHRVRSRRQWLQPGEADRKLADLLAARQRPDLLPLSRNPLLLTLMASLHANRGRLPDDRADLYNESVDLLMLRWNRQIGADKALLDALAIPTLKLSDLREVLEELAFAVHAESVVHDHRLAADQTATSGAGGTADIGEGRLLQAFRPLLEGSWDKAAVVVDYIEKRAGLLLGQGDRNGERQFAFPHRTFQEFLAACHLAARQDFASECARLAREAPGHWQVVLPLAARIAKAERGTSAADELIGGTPIADFCRRRTPDAADWTCALLAGMQLLEIGVGAIRQRDRTSAIAKRVAEWLAASLPLHPDDGGAASAQRARAGDVLAQLGDPRFDPQRFHLPTDEMLGFVRIPADPEFMIGTRRHDAARVSKIIGGKVYDDEINDAPTPEFYIARYPVTVAEFRAFVEATGFAIGDAGALTDPDSRAVRSVSWHEAQAWCDWLSETLATSPACVGSPIAPAGTQARFSGGLAERTRVGESGARWFGRQRFSLARRRRCEPCEL